MFMEICLNMLEYDDHDILVGGSPTSIYINTTKVWVGFKMEDHHLTIPTLVEVWAAHNCNWAEDGSIQNHWKIRKTHF